MLKITNQFFKLKKFLFLSDTDIFRIFIVSFKTLVCLVEKVSSQKITVKGHRITFIKKKIIKATFTMYERLTKTFYSFLNYELKDFDHYSYINA